MTFKPGDVVVDLAPADYGMGVVEDVSSEVYWSNSGVLLTIRFFRHKRFAGVALRTPEQVRLASKLERAMK